ncbi:hypothetical protein PS2_018087 [Malus domestica]
MASNKQGEHPPVEASKQQREEGSQQHATRDGESKHEESGKVWSNKGRRTKPSNAAEAQISNGNDVSRPPQNPVR